MILQINRNYSDSFVCEYLFDRFEVGSIPKEIKEFRGNRSTETNIHRTLVCACSCVGFIGLMLNNKRSTYFTNLFSPKNFKKNNEETLNIVLKYLNMFSNLIMYNNNNGR